MNPQNARQEYWSQKLGFPVKEFDAVVPIEKSAEPSNPLVAQYLRDKNGTN